MGLVTEEVKGRKQEGFVESDTKVGYILTGPIRNNEVERCATNFVHTLSMVYTVSESKTLDSQQKQFWKLDSIGTKTMKNLCTRNLEKLLSETILTALRLIADSRKNTLYYPMILK